MQRVHLGDGGLRPPGGREGKERGRGGRGGPAAGHLLRQQIEHAQRSPAQSADSRLARPAGSRKGIISVNSLPSSV